MTSRPTVDDLRRDPPIRMVLLEGGTDRAPAPDQRVDRAREHAGLAHGQRQELLVD